MGLNVVPEFIRALPAALLVGLVPGWFWAGCLCSTADRAERLAYSVALSITLVPAVALVQTRLFEMGVTLTIAVVSVLLVFLAGLAAYLRFGPAKGYAQPLMTRPAPLDLPTLIPLVLASAVLLRILFGLVSSERVTFGERILPAAQVAPAEQIAPLIALLVLSGGIAHLLGSRRDGLLSPSREQASGFSGSWLIPAVRWCLLSAVMLLVLLRSYSGPLRYDWPFPRGVDKFEHAVMASMMMSEGATGSFMLYPPGLHLLTAEICRLSGLDPLAAFAVLAPSLLLLPPLACYVLGRRLWGWEVGVAAALFCGLIVDGPYLHVTQARYANLIGAQFLLVLAVGVLIQLYAFTSVRNRLTLAVLGSSVVLYHQAASLYEAALLGLVATLFLPYLLLRDRSTGLALVSSLTLLGVLSVLFAWDTYDLPSLVGGLLGGSETGRGGEAVEMALGTRPPFTLGHLLGTTSQLALWLALLGALLLLSDRGNATSTSDTLARVTILLWTLLLFVGSRTSLSAFPDRFERDLSVPLALLAALALVTALRSLSVRGTVRISMAMLAVLLVGIAVELRIALTLEEAGGPSQRSIDGPPPPEVAAAGDWLREHNSGGSILATPSVQGTSARGVLAMGGYTGMQSYTRERIKRARDLPPFGAGPLWDAQWALQHPTDRRTREILRKNDVRYVVLHKRNPNVDWHSFGRQEDLYRLVYENESVVILEPRET
ncbi:MAG: hypothetical protein M3151_01645 [Actinomycetota bacterium]|nr:hypothetical protein [Actinomycetota bacterium]